MFIKPLILTLHLLLNNLSILTQEASEEGGGFFLIALIIWIISLFLVRIWMLRYVVKLMNKKSDEVSSDIPSELKNPEVKAKNQPKFLDLDKNIDHTRAIERREEFVKNAYLLFRKKYFFGLLACLLYIVLPLIFGKIGGETIGEGRIEFIVGAAILYFVYISLVFYFYRKQFRAENAKFGIRIEHPAVTLLRKLVNPQYESYFTLGLILALLSIGLNEMSLLNVQTESLFKGTTPWFGFGFILAAIIHIVMIYKVRKKSYRVPNMTLLILRVFGNEKQATLTFGRLINFWKHFGSWFTIVDPSFMGRRFRIFTIRTLVTLLIIFVAATGIGLLLGDYFVPIVKFFIPNDHASNSEVGEFALIPGMMIAWLLYLQYWRFTISRSYAKNIKGIKKKISEVVDKPRKQDMTFKNLPMFCFDNTWKLAVGEFIKNSRAVLMDLRGFSAERKGCEYEVDFLLDVFPVSAVLFLVDNNSDKQLVKQLIVDRWEFLRINSPNINIENPVVKIFAATMADEEDVQTILDLLVEATDITA